MKKYALYLITCLLAVAPVFADGGIAGQRYTSTLLEQEESGQDSILVHYTLSSRLLYPNSEVIYTFFVESSADIHLSNVLPPQAAGVTVRRVNQDHDYYFVGSQQYRISSYQFALSTDLVGEFELRGASVFHRKVDGMGAVQQVAIEAEPLVITGHDIPLKYRGLWLPSDQVTIEQTWSDYRLEIEVGDAVTRTVTLFIQGIGVDQFPTLEIPNPSTVNVYSKPISFKEHDGGTSMTIEQTLVPRQSGALVLPTLTIPWFNLTNNTIQTATARGVELNVTSSMVSSDSDELIIPTTSDSFVKDWRTVAGAVTLLWLMTLMLAYRLYMKTKQGRSRKSESSTATPNSLYQSVLNNEPQRAAYFWTHESVELKRLYSSEFNRYIAAHYSADCTEQEEAKSMLLKALRQSVKPSSVVNEKALSTLIP
jgi:hypothetical protein